MNATTSAPNTGMTSGALADGAENAQIVHSGVVEGLEQTPMRANGSRRTIPGTVGTTHDAQLTRAEALLLLGASDSRRPAPFALANAVAPGT